MTSFDWLFGVTISPNSEQTQFFIKDKEKQPSGDARIVLAPSLAAQSTVTGECVILMGVSGWHLGFWAHAQVWADFVPLACIRTVKEPLNANCRDDNILPLDRTNTAPIWF